MHHPTRIMIGLASAALMTVATVAVATSASAAGQSTLSSGDALGLGDDGTTLRIFELKDPDDDDLVGQVSGLVGSDSALIGIDYRVQDGKLYGVGNAGGIYTINAGTGVGDQGRPADGRARRHAVRHRLQPGRRPAAHRQQHRPEPAPQRRRGQHDDVDGVAELRDTAHGPRVSLARRTPTTTSTRTRPRRCSTSTPPSTRSRIQLPPNDGSLSPTGKARSSPPSRLSDSTFRARSRPVEPSPTPDTPPSAAPTRRSRTSTRSTCSPARQRRSTTSTRQIADIAVKQP